MGVNKRGFVLKVTVLNFFSVTTFKITLKFAALAVVCAACLSPAAALPPAEPSPAGTNTLASLSARVSPALELSAFSGPGVPVDRTAPENPIFYDKPLVLRQYGYGMLAGVVAGSLGFYIGNAFEGMIFGSNSRKGYLSFTGVRYEHSRRFLGMPAGGPFLGGSLGLLGGSAFTAFFVGDSDEEPGSILWTVAGGAVSTVAALALADAAGVGKDRGMLPFLPLVALPPIGAVGGYQVSRWFNDRKRRRVTEPGGEHSGVLLHAPRLGMAPGPDGMVMRLEALHLTF